MSEPLETVQRAFREGADLRLSFALDMGDRLVEASDRILESLLADRVQLVLDALPESFVEVEPRSIEQVLVNLAVNALEAMPEGGSLRLHAEQQGGTVVIAVEDTGAGVPDAARERLFALHVTTKESGTGIGLYTSAAIASALGGVLRLDRTGPTGTTFILELPALA